jgi:ABC-type glycerol-3-phosphate transport system permease component
MLLPGQVTIIPLFKFFAYIGWINTYYPLIVPAWFGANVFGIFLLRQFFLTIPRSYIEAARMDGATELHILWNIVVPLSTPVLLTITVFTFLGSWNDLFGPLIYLHDERLYTMPVGLFSFIAKAGVLVGGGGTQVTPWNLVMALTTVMIVPVVIVFFLAQKRFIEGISASGLKG